MVEIPSDLLLKPVFEHDVCLIKRIHKFVVVVRPLGLALHLPKLPVQLHALLENILHVLETK